MRRAFGRRLRERRRERDERGPPKRRLTPSTARRWTFVSSLTARSSRSPTARRRRWPDGRPRPPPTNRRLRRGTVRWPHVRTPRTGAVVRDRSGGQAAGKPCFAGLRRFRARKVRRVRKDGPHVETWFHASGARWGPRVRACGGRDRAPQRALCGGGLRRPRRFRGLGRWWSGEPRRLASGLRDLHQAPRVHGRRSHRRA